MLNRSDIPDSALAIYEKRKIFAKVCVFRKYEIYAFYCKILRGCVWGCVCVCALLILLYNIIEICLSLHNLGFCVENSAGDQIDPATGRKVMGL